jgi:selenocysteine-specific elongation factor
MNVMEAPRLDAAAHSVVMGTAGHIDHGKTSLVLALTGTDTDRLPEEKTRGITIDLGFAALDLKDENGRTVHIGVVDVPGHHAFIHNMLAGAGGIDCVMLVVAADEGVKAQTTEHLAICSLLGVGNGLVALTKRDAVSPERLQAVRRDVRVITKGTFLESAPVIAVSARTGEGIEELKRSLVHLALGVPQHSTDTLLRLPLDRAFSVAGFGTVVTGTLRDGSVQQGDTVELQPSGRVVRVRGVQVHHHPVKEAHAPTRAALNLVGIEVGDVRRGDTLVQQGTFVPAKTVDVEVTVLPGVRPLRHRGQMGLHAFTSESAATVLLYGGDEDVKAGSRLARLRLKKPMLLVPGDHFVLRQPDGIIGGGRVLDASPMPRWRKVALRQWLEQIRNASIPEQLLLRVQRHGLEGISLTALKLETGLREDAISRLIATLIASKQVLGAKIDHPSFDRFLIPDALKKACELLMKELTKKESRSSPRAELLSRTRLQGWVFDLAAEALRQQNRIRTTGSEISINTGDSAGGRQAEIIKKLEDLYRSAGLASPLVAEVAAALRLAPKDASSLITQLLRAGKLVRMGSDNLLIHTDALAGLKSELIKLHGQTLDVGRFKTITGLTRKHAIPLLEYLDRERVTVNKQGVRTIL